ncbi:MAG: hypothetical protein WDZ37_01270 [Solirubrobacterales bacterium]
MAKKKKKQDSPGARKVREMLLRGRARPAPINRTKDAWYLQQRADLNRREAEAQALGRIRDSGYSVEDAMRATGASPEEMWESAKDHTKQDKRGAT